MANATVVYYSSTGHVHRLAAAAAEAAEKEGARVRLRRIPDAVPDQDTADRLAADRDAWEKHTAATADVPAAALEDLEWADAILVGSPVRYGLPAPALMAWLDTTTRMAIEGRLQDKAVTSFASGDGLHAGHETTILGLHNTFCHWGALIVSNGITDPVLYKPDNGCPYGTSTVSKKQPGPVSDQNIAAMEYQARRTVRIAEALRSGLADR